MSTPPAWIATLVLAVLTLSAVVLPAKAQAPARPGLSQQPSITQPRTPLSAGPSAQARLDAPVILQLPDRPTARSARAGGLSVESQRSRLQSSNVAIGRLRQDVGAMRVPDALAARGAPAITSVNNASSGNIEPGGAYEIRGRGFGSRGTVFLMDPALGRPLALDVQHWQDDRIYASLREDVSRVPDVSRVKLVVAPTGGQAIESTRFNFVAAREEVLIPTIARAAIQTRSSRFLPIVSNDRNGLFVRLAEEGASSERCHSPGQDAINAAAIPVKPGFWVHSFEVSFPTLRSEERRGEHYTGFGAYRAAWRGDDIIIDWGVQRLRTSTGLVPQPLPLPLPQPRVGTGSFCETSYRIKVFAVGPRGMPPL